MKQWQSPVRAVDLPPEDLAGVVDSLLEKLGLRIMCEQTPDYTSYELQAIDGVKEVPDAG